MTIVTDSEEPLGHALLIIGCPGECGKFLGLHETSTPEFVVFDEEEFPGDD